MSITEFLLARIAEDEDRNNPDPDPSGSCDYLHGVHYDSARVLAECAAKRAIVDIHGDRDGDCARCSDYAWFAVLDGGEREEFPCPTLRTLAAVYADHPDYRPEWSPQDNTPTRGD